MKVVSTQQGFYANRIIDEGEVFELLYNADGSDPVREDWVPKLDRNGKDTGEGEYVMFKDANGKPVHRDFAPDTGDYQIRSGPRRGEVTRTGWMQEVPEHTPVTIHDLGSTELGFDVQSRKPRTLARAARPMLPKQAKG